MIGRSKSKKGLTPIIAVILLLMMTVAAAGAAFFWFVRVQGELQGGEEQHAQNLAEKVSSSVEVVISEYNRYGPYNHTLPGQTNTKQQGNLTLILKNTGSARVTLTNASAAPTTTWILQDNQQKIVCSDDWFNSPSKCISGCGGDLNMGSIGTVVLNLSGVCDIGNSTLYPNETAFQFKLDFSGQTASGGGFRK